MQPSLWYVSDSSSSGVCGRRRWFALVRRGTQNGDLASFPRGSRRPKRLATPDAGPVSQSSVGGGHSSLGPKARVSPSPHTSRPCRWAARAGRSVVNPTIIGHHRETQVSGIVTYVDTSDGTLVPSSWCARLRLFRYVSMASRRAHRMEQVESHDRPRTHRPSRTWWSRRIRMPIRARGPPGRFPGDPCDGQPSASRNGNPRVPGRRGRL